MNFNTALFLFLFLPSFLVLYFVGQRRWRPAIGILASLIFYAWGQVGNLPVIVGILLINYWIALRIKARSTRWLLISGIAANLGILIFYKLLVTYGVGMFLGLQDLFPQSANKWLASLSFPLGLSYISFQVISYLIDVWRGTVEPERNLVSFAFYVLLFPKLLVGPIVRYKNLAGQLSEPAISSSQIANGIRRFMLGFAKKILIADILAKVVNAVFSLPVAGISPLAAWIALPAYMLQIYFDFSGFTDMAIGLAAMMGLNFPENFNHPYIAQSIGDFWRRWHITLSTWFRDYVFFPLERRRLPVIGQSLNIMIVFLLTGLWHGVTPIFIVWGLVHGFFIAVEGWFLNRWLQKVIQPVRHVYTLSVLLLTWLIFRAPTLRFAWGYIGRLSGSLEGLRPLPFTETTPLPFLEPSFLLALGLGILFALPVHALIQRGYQSITARLPWAALPLTAAGDVLTFAIFVLSVGMMAAGKFLPGIYGRF